MNLKGQHKRLFSGLGLRYSGLIDAGWSLIGNQFGENHWQRTNGCEWTSGKDLAVIVAGTAPTCGRCDRLAVTSGETTNRRTDNATVLAVTDLTGQCRIRYLLARREPSAVALAIARWLRTALGWAAFLEAQAALARWTLNGVTCETGRLADALLARTGRRNGVILVVDGIVDHTNLLDTSKGRVLLRNVQVVADSHVTERRLHGPIHWYCIVGLCPNGQDQ